MSELKTFYMPIAFACKKLTVPCQILLFLAIFHFGSLQTVNANPSCTEIFPQDDRTEIEISPRWGRWTSSFLRDRLPLFKMEQTLALWLNHRPNIALTPEGNISLRPHDGQLKFLTFPESAPNKAFGISEKLNLQKVALGQKIKFIYESHDGVVIAVIDNPYREIKIRKYDGKVITISFDPQKQKKWGRLFEIVTVSPRGIMHFIQVYDGVSPGSATKFPQLEMLMKLLTLIPHEYVDVIEQIVLNPTKNVWDPYWALNYGIRDFTSAATAGRTQDNVDSITLHHDFNNKLFSRDLAKTFLHEFGHLFAILKFGTTTPPDYWISAMKKDGGNITWYAGKSPAEDFAETVAYYLIMGNSPQLRFFFKNRFEILDDLFRVVKN